ncbi:MAG: zf-HC2 domain-containing protein [Thermoleophilaceae bacterium]
MALREVRSWLPALDPPAARALALAVLAERPRAEVAILLDMSEYELGRELAAARKELRQTLVTLGGSGWCERAEGLISDRLDGVLADTDVRRLDVHLRNCTRCVEHERRLVQATDALVIGLGGRPAPSAGAPAPLVEAPADDRGEGGDAHGPEAPTAEAATPAPPPDAAPPARGAPTAAEIAAAAEVLVTRRTRGQVAAAVVWNSMIAISILLALVTIAIVIVGITGGHL